MNGERPLEAQTLRPRSRPRRSSGVDVSTLLHSAERQLVKDDATSSAGDGIDEVHYDEQ